jgi:hypothetical protein
MSIMQRQHTYENVSAADHHDDDDSSTEVESLVGAEKRWQSEGFQSRTRKSKRNLCMSFLKASRWLVVIGLQFIIIGLLAKDQGMLLVVQWWPSRTTSEREIGGDVTGWGPHSQ